LRLWHIPLPRGTIREPRELDGTPSALITKSFSDSLGERFQVPASVESWLIPAQEILAAEKLVVI
jgi:hypothetical protein